MRIKKLLITGCNGCLGGNLIRYFKSLGWEVVGTDIMSRPFNRGFTYIGGDLADEAFVEQLFATTKPEYVINTVALVNLDLCEEDHALADRVNVVTARNIAKQAKIHNSRLIHISTDHFFSGRKSFYTEDDKPEPVNYYGVSKLRAEQECLNNHNKVAVVRTNFYGWSHPQHKPSFGEWLYASLKNRLPITLFTDYYFTPIEATALAEALKLILLSDYFGVLNVAGSERCSKYDFGVAMAEIFGLSKERITAAKTSGTSFKVRRQLDLSLSVDKYRRLFQYDLPGLADGLKRFINGVEKNDRYNSNK